MLYSQIVADYFARPANAGRLPDDAGAVISGRSGDRANGTEIVFHVLPGDGEISRISFESFGCPHTIAACSLATERLIGQPPEALVELTAAALAEAIEAPPEKMGRLLLIEDALRNCFVAWDNSQV